MIQPRNKIDSNFNSSSMADLVFLLLIFFMLTSTLISPNAIKLLLPQSTAGQTLAKQTVTVSIDDQFNYYIENLPVEDQAVLPTLEPYLQNTVDGTVKLFADKTTPIQYVVNIIDAVNKINEKYGAKHKVILATEAPN